MKAAYTVPWILNECLNHTTSTNYRIFSLWPAIWQCNGDLYRKQTTVFTVQCPLFNSCILCSGEALFFVLKPVDRYARSWQTLPPPPSSRSYPSVPSQHKLAPPKWMARLWANPWIRLHQTFNWLSRVASYLSSQSEGREGKESCTRTETHTHAHILIDAYSLAKQLLINWSLIDFVSVRLSYLLSFVPY